MPHCCPHACCERTHEKCPLDGQDLDAGGLCREVTRLRVRLENTEARERVALDELARLEKYRDDLEDKCR